MFTSEALIALAVFVLANLAAASSGAMFRPGAWYAGLAKPSWTPPNWAFPVVWTILFVLNAVSGWLVWQAGGMDAAGALGLYGASLVINASWSGVFFGLRRMGLGLVVVTALWLSIAGVMAAFAPFSPVAAGILAPYLVWVTIAAALNLRVWQLNPAAARPPEPLTR
jgi:tryptophan-rich sensory protein